MKKVLHTIIILFLLTPLMGCMQVVNHGDAGNIKNRDKKGLEQTKNNLLAGTSKAICYSGFRKSQHPDRGDGAVNPSYTEILEDLKILSDHQFNLIRLYDCGENTQMTLKVIRDNNLDIKVMLGIWLKAELSNHKMCAWLTEPIPGEELAKNKNLNLSEINSGIRLANKYKDIIVAVNVGNEALVDWNDHKVDVDTVISYVGRVKNSVHQPVTVADNYKWWAENGRDLARAVDFVSLHIYPVWENKTIEDGLPYTIENYHEVQKALPDKKILITEAGWPSAGSQFPDRANEENQRKYFNQLMAWAEKMKITTFWFEAFDEEWKGNSDNPLGAEKHWGLFTIDRKPKMVMENFPKEEMKLPK